MKNTLLRFIALVFIPLSHSFANTLESLFKESYYTNYRSGYCGDNIMKFAKLAAEYGIDLSEAQIIDVNGGWVEPLYVRNGGYRADGPGAEFIRFEPSSKYYYFHIFMVHKNKVYDFDYGNKPVVSSVATYFNKMWISGKQRDKSLWLNIYRAEDLISGKPKPTNPPTMSLLNYIESRSR